MNLDDESLLSAYPDGELEPAHRLVVEAGLLESPELAERLAGAAAVRALVGGLSRPILDDDLSAAVQAGAAGLDRARHLRVRVFSLAAAAVMMLACIPLFVNWPREPGRVLPHPKLVGVEPRAQAPKAAVEAPSKEAGVEAVAGMERASGDQLRLQSMLEEPGVRRLVVVIDHLSPELVTRVEGAIIATDRRDPAYGVVHVGQGQELDPTMPREAYVFALRMDDAERDQLEEALGQPEMEGVRRVAEEDVASAVVTQLSELEPSRFGEGRAVSVVANRPLAPLSTPEKLASRRAHDPAMPLEGAAAPVAAATVVERQRVYLVWVTTPAQER